MIRKKRLRSGKRILSLSVAVLAFTRVTFVSKANAANTLTGMDGAGNAEQTFSKTIDTKAPVISECELLEDNKITLATTGDVAGNPIKLKSGFTGKTVTATEGTGNIAFRFESTIYEPRVAPSAVPAA